MGSEPSKSLTEPHSSDSRNRWLVGLGLLFATGAGSAFLVLQPSPNIARANRFVQTGEHELAHSELDRLLNNDPAHPAALLLKGDLLRRQNNLEAAIDCYRRVPADVAEYRQASRNCIQASLEMLDLAGAEQQMLWHLEQFPDERAIWDELRWLCFNQFRTRDVVELSHWWLKRHPEDSQALTHLLLGVFRPQVPQEGTPYLKQVQAAFPRQVPVLRALAWAAWQSGKRDEAKQLLAKAWRAGADDPRTRFLSAEVLIDEHDIDAADRVLGTIPFGVSGEISGNQTDRWHWLRSRVLIEQNDVTASLQHVERAIQSDNGNLEYIHEQAVLLKRLGREDEAAKAFRKARTIEQCRKRLAEIAFSGEWKVPNTAIREEIADLYQQCGDDLAATLWRQ